VKSLSKKQNQTSKILVLKFPIQQSKQDYTKTYFNQTVKKSRTQMILKPREKKQIVHKGVLIRLAAKVSTETL
jgi:hypothetical protein